MGNLPIGGNNPIVVQSMTNTITKDVDTTVSQIRRLADAGCELVRLAAPDIDSAISIGSIKEQVDLPLIADIHFDCRIAIAAIDREWVNLVTFS